MAAIPNIDDDLFAHFDLYDSFFRECLCCNAVNELPGVVQRHREQFIATLGADTPIPVHLFESTIDAASTESNIVVKVVVAMLQRCRCSLCTHKQLSSLHALGFSPSSDE